MPPRVLCASTQHVHPSRWKMLQLDRPGGLVSTLITPPPAPPAWSCAEPCTVSAWSRGKAPVHQQPRRTGATPGHLQADDVIVQGCQDAAQHVDCALAGLRHGDEVVKHAGPCRWVLLLQAINSLSALWTMGTSSDGRRLRHGSARLPCTQLPGCLQTCRGRGGGGA